MKINALIVFLSLFCFSLSAQTDKTAITTDFINGLATGQKHAMLKQYFHPNMIFTWQDGNIWPDGSDGSLEQFWSLYTSFFKNYDTEITELTVRELDNETYVFATYSIKVLKDDKRPEWVGTTAKGPAAYRIIWENNQIKHLYYYEDTKTREEQREAQFKKN